jgi:hypothetical protein
MVDFTKPVITRAGWPVIIWTTEAHDTQWPVRGEYYKDGKWIHCVWTLEGIALEYSSDSSCSLINPPEEIEGVFNIYKNALFGENIFVAYGHSSMEEAIKGRGASCQATVPIKFKEGEGL